MLCSRIRRFLFNKSRSEEKKTIIALQFAAKVIVIQLYVMCSPVIHLHIFKNKRFYVYLLDLFPYVIPKVFEHKQLQRVVHESVLQQRRRRQQQFRDRQADVSAFPKQSVHKHVR